MNKKLFTILLSCASCGVMAQNLFPSIQTLPSTGLEMLREQEPFLLEQENLGGDWTNYYQFKWEPSSVPGIKQSFTVENWLNNSWLLTYHDKDSILGVNAANKPLGVIQHLYYNYPGFTSEYRYRYTYDYTVDNRISYFKMERELPVGSGSYQTFQDMFINYNGSIRESDSSISGSTTSITHYVYQNGRVIASHSLSSPDNDTIARTYYGYQDTLLAFVFSETKEPNTDMWETQTADSITYTGGKVTHHVYYGYSSINGGQPTFQPIEDERYTYDANGRLATIIEKQWMNNQWANVSKYTFEYDAAGKPSLGLRYMANSATTYATEPRYRFLFAPNTGISNIDLQSAMIDAFPNPANAQITIKAPFPISSIVLTDVQGKHIDEVTIDTFADGYTIHTANLKNGLYFVQITSGDARLFKKVMINH